MNIFNKNKISNVIFYNYINIFKFNFARQIYKKSYNRSDVEPYNKNLSKYKLDPDLTINKINSVKQGIPNYLTKGSTINNNENSNIKTSLNNGNNKIQLNKLMKSLKPGKKMLLSKRKFMKKPKKQVLIAQKRALKNIAFEKKHYELLTKQDRLLLDINHKTNKNQYSIDRHNKGFIQLEKERLKIQTTKEKHKQIENKKRVFNLNHFEHKFMLDNNNKNSLRFILDNQNNQLAKINNLNTINNNNNDDNEFENTERLSKRLAKLGVCSRRYAEELIKKKMVRVDNNFVSENVPVTNSSKIEILTNKGYQVPVKFMAKLWVFYKPKNYVCSRTDIRNRPTIYNILNSIGFDHNHIIPIAPLDYSSEGLLLLTNSGELSKILENNKTIERSYKIRVFGRMFTESKLNLIKKGVSINLKKIQYWVELIRKQTTNTWLHLKSYDNSLINIRHIFRKLSLRVNRIIRVSYGPFTLGSSSYPGEINRVEIPRTVGNYVYYHNKEKLSTALDKFEKTKIKKSNNNIKNTKKYMNIIDKEVNKIKNLENEAVKLQNAKIQNVNSKDSITRRKLYNYQKTSL